MILGYSRNDMALRLKGHRLELELELRQQQYGVGSNSMSAFFLNVVCMLLDFRFLRASAMLKHVIAIGLTTT